MSAGEGMVTCASCGEQNRVGARFCDACGARLEPAPAPGQSRRTVTIVFVDVAGSTALGERLDPETLRDLMGRYFDVARTVVERHGGIVEKFIGDAVMAVFGLPTLHEDDALRAVRAADELQRRLGEGELASWITTRMGINTGEVVASDRADAQRLVTGDAVNTAARLEQHAPPGGILLGNDTWRLVRDAVTVEAVAPVAAKGKQEPLTAWRLVSSRSVGRGDVAPAGRAARRSGTRAGATAAQLRGRRRRAALRAVTLLGPAGVGKSRLVHELVQRVRGSATILRGRCLPYGEGVTYWPVAEVMRAAAVIDEADGRETALTKLGTLVAGGPDADDNVQFIAAAIGIVTAMLRERRSIVPSGERSRCWPQSDRWSSSSMTFDGPNRPSSTSSSISWTGAGVHDPRGGARAAGPARQAADLGRRQAGCPDRPAGGSGGRHPHADRVAPRVDPGARSAPPGRGGHRGQSAVRGAADRDAGRGRPPGP